jgi:hypothetical protein
LKCECASVSRLTNDLFFKIAAAMPQGAFAARPIPQVGQTDNASFYNIGVSRAKPHAHQ